MSWIRNLLLPLDAGLVVTACSLTAPIANIPTDPIDALTATSAVPRRPATAALEKRMASFGPVITATEKPCPQAIGCVGACEYAL